MKKQIDFTQGSISKQMLLFTIPIAMGELLQNLYSSVDTLVVGNLVGDQALAAVSVCIPLVDLIIGFFNGMSAGASVAISQALGERNTSRLYRTMSLSFSIAVVVGFIMSAASVLCAPLLLDFVDVQPEIRGGAMTYLRIYLVGVMFTVIYNFGAGILRAVGDSGTPFAILIMTCCLNTVLDILFVSAFHAGVAGVGAATIISQGISAGVVYLIIKKRYPLFSLNIKWLLTDRKAVGTILGIGAPAGLQNSLIAFSNMFTWRYVNGFDSIAISAGIGVAQRIDRFVALPGKAIGLTMGTFIGQNVGAGNEKRNKEGVFRGFILAGGIVSVLGIGVYLFAPEFAGLFNENAEVKRIAANMIRTIVPLYMLLASREVLLGTLRGYGETKIPMILSIVGMVGVRQAFLAITMHCNPVVENIYWCYPVGWGANALLLALYYYKK